MPDSSREELDMFELVADVVKKYGDNFSINNKCMEYFKNNSGLNPGMLRYFSMITEKLLEDDRYYDIYLMFVTSLINRDGKGIKYVFGTPVMGQILREIGISNTHSFVKAFLEFLGSFIEVVNSWIKEEMYAEFLAFLQEYTAKRLGIEKLKDTPDVWWIRYFVDHTLKSVKPAKGWDFSAKAYDGKAEFLMKNIEISSHKCDLRSRGSLVFLPVRVCVNMRGIELVVGNEKAGKGAGSARG